MRRPPCFRLNPDKDHETIVRWMAVDTWKFDLVRATEIALLKTFAIPGIAKILASSGEFLNRTQKRFDDTDILLSLFIENGYSSPEGRQAIRNINRMHARHPIANEQMLYVLSTFVVDPIIWIEKYGLRPLNTLEKSATFQFWINVGRLMGIKNLFSSLVEMQAYHEQYEQRYMVYAEDNERLFHGVLPAISRMMPPVVGPLLQALLPSVMPPRMCRALGVVPHGRLKRAAVLALFKTRAHVARFVRGRPEYRTQLPHPTYPNGYVNERLGV